MTLQHVTDDLAAKAQAKPGDTHRIQLKRGLRLALRYRRKHYTLSISRMGVWPSVGERAILRRSFGIPGQRKWRTFKRKPVKGWYIFWNPGNCGTGPVPDVSKQLLMEWSEGVGPAGAAGRGPGGPT